MTNDTESADRTFERLNETYAELKSEKDGLAGQIKQLEESLKTLKKDLKDQHGTDDLGKLQKLLEEKEKDNASKSEQYEKHLVDLQEKLASLEEAVDSDHPESDEDDLDEEDDA
jgi:DNA repair exonuclease SbcCD ATPase subunit